MSEYTPDNWVVLKIMLPDQDTLYKVLGGWSGRYLDGDSWRMNSGITSFEAQAHLYGFYGSSGSVYWCHKDAYRLTMATSGVYNQLKEQFGDVVKLMTEDTDWSEVKWIIQK